MMLINNRDLAHDFLVLASIAIVTALSAVFFLSVPHHTCTTAMHGLPAMIQL